MTNVSIPTPVRVACYLGGMAVSGIGNEVVDYLAQKAVIDDPLHQLLDAICALGVVIMGILALSHLSLPDSIDDQDTAPALDTDGVEGTYADDTAT